METPATKWQPIATAPRDTPILVTDGEVVVVVEIGEHWRGSERTWPVGGFGDEWEWEFELEDLTHWMTLPKPPEKGK